MARRSGIELEVLPVDDGHVAGPRAKRSLSRRGWLILGTLGAAVGVVAGPVRAALDRRAVDATVGAFAIYRGYEEQRLEQSTPLVGAKVPDNEEEVDAALAALDREEAAHLRSIAAGLRFPLVVDPSQWTMERAMGSALRARATDLASQAAWLTAPGSRGPQTPDPSTGTQRALDHALALLGAHIGSAGGHAPNDAPRPLHSADAVIARLHGWADHPTGTVLVGGDGLALYELDIDTAGVSANDFQTTGSEPAGPSYLIGRQGWTAAMIGNQVAAYPSGRPPHLLPFDVVSSVFAAERLDAVWLVMDGLAVVEVDQSGRALSPLWQLPRGAFVSPAVVTGGLVLSTQAGALEAWVPSTGALTPITKGPAVLLGAHGQLVVWERDIPGPNEPSAPLHVTDLATGDDEVISSRLDVQVPEDRIATACAFSPDGRSVACHDLTHGEPGFDDATYDVAVIDLATHSARVVAGASSQQPQQPLVWTADSRRLFTLTTASGSTYIAMWEQGAATATELRYHPKALVGLAVLGQ